MANAQVVSLVAHETRRVQAETAVELDALTKDFYAALAANREEIAEAFATVLHEAMQAPLVELARLRKDVDELKAKP
jgi:hypothetical protein